MKRFIFMVAALAAIYVVLLLLEGTGEAIREVIMRYTPVKG